MLQHLPQPFIGRVFSRNVDEDTALSVAVLGRQEQITQILLDYGCITKIAVDKRNSHEDTVLHCAVRTATMPIVEMLLKSHAEIYVRDSNDNTALLHRAAIHGQQPQEGIMQLLLHFDVNQTNAVNFGGHAVLHFSVTYRRRNMIPVLIRHSEPEKPPIICRMRDHFGRMPLDVARAAAEHTKSPAPKSLYCSGWRLLWSWAIPLSKTLLEGNRGEKSRDIGLVDI